MFGCIAYLAEHRNRAVGRRDELIAAVWGRTEVTDNLLDSDHAARSAPLSGDVDGERRMIRTVPRFGFSWVAPTTLVEEGDKHSGRSRGAFGAGRTARRRAVAVAQRVVARSHRFRAPCVVAVLAAPRRHRCTALHAVVDVRTDYGTGNHRPVSPKPLNAREDRGRPAFGVGTARRDGP